MTDEQKILNSFRAMDDRRKREAVARMERISKTHPDKQPAKLRLVAGSSVRTSSPKLRGCTHDFESTIGIGAVVKIK